MYANIDKDLQNNLGLKFGEALTEEQQSKLDKDIIWYVKQDITIQDENGNDIIIKDVLVPQIYLSANNQKLLNENLNILNSAGSMIAGNNINLQLENNLTNSNNSTIQSKNNTIITAENDINIEGATTRANNNLDLQTNNGNINITTKTLSIFYEQKSGDNGDTYHKINTDSKNLESNLISNNGSITLQANNNNKNSNNDTETNNKGNINIVGSNIQAETGINLFAENDKNNR